MSWLIATYSQEIMLCDSSGIWQYAGNGWKYQEIQVYAMSWLVATCEADAVKIMLCDSSGIWQFAGNDWKYQEIQLYDMSWLVATCSQEIMLCDFCGIWQFAGNVA